MEGHGTLELGVAWLSALVFRARKLRPRLPGMHAVSPGKKKGTRRGGRCCTAGLANLARLAELLVTWGEATLEGGGSV